MIKNTFPDFNFSTIQLEDDRVKLLPLQQEHLIDLLSFSLNEPEIWTYSMISAGGGTSAMQAYLKMAIEAREQKREMPFLVFDKQTQRVAGSTRFYDIQSHNLSMQLGYTWYGKEFQGTGLNQHCKFLMLQFAFETCNLVRVEFRADAANHRSIAAMKRIGCKEEGVLRQNGFRNDGTMRDSMVLSILVNEWHEYVKPHLLKLIS
ncbi:MAG TPA: GNAT family protein [Chitinophagaceae bacterium]|nr:GNAT family protein [Chitinophagaceae bacterium]